METHYIRYKGKDYEVKEPTISQWHELMITKDLMTSNDYNLNLIEIITGLSRDEIRNAPADDIRLASAGLSRFLMSVDSRFHETFTFKDVEYKFIDLNNLTFGEFVDIDTFLSRPDSVKSKEMNFFMALLYRPLVDGKISPYIPSEVSVRAELFKDLPMKYLNGASSFFFHLENILSDNTPSYLVKVRRMKSVLMMALINTGAGIAQSYIWLMTISSKFLMWLKSRLPKRLTS